MVGCSWAVGELNRDLIANQNESLTTCMDLLHHLDLSALHEILQTVFLDPCTRVHSNVVPQPHLECKGFLKSDAQSHCSERKQNVNRTQSCTCPFKQ